MSPRRKTFTFYIDDTMKAALQVIRDRDGITEAEQIRRGVQMWIDSRNVITPGLSVRKAERKRAVTRKRS